MTMQNIVVQLIGFEEVFHPEFNLHLRDQLLLFNSKLFSMEICEDNLNDDINDPDMSVVAISGRESSSALVRKFCKCRSSNVVTIGQSCSYTNFLKAELSAWPEGLVTAAIAFGNNSNAASATFLLSSQSPRTIPMAL